MPLSSTSFLADSAKMERSMKAYKQKLQNIASLVRSQEAVDTPRTNARLVRRTLRRRFGIIGLALICIMISCTLLDRYAYRSAKQSEYSSLADAEAEEANRWREAASSWERSSPVTPGRHRRRRTHLELQRRMDKSIVHTQLELRYRKLADQWRKAALKPWSSSSP
jgi:hypothetical protein